MSEAASYKHLFGPVPSRRFGRSLGVDLVPLKTCSLNCVFCQLGRSARRTLERREYVPTAEVIAELDAWIEGGTSADFITLSGSGEPTLHTCFGDILEHVRDRTKTPTTLLTNGTTLRLPEVRAAARKASVVKVSLSAWDQASFERINRPHPDVTFAGLVEGETTFRAEFDGELWLEVFLIEGINADAEAVRKIAEIVKPIAPDKVHLNTAVRPPAESFARAVAAGRLQELAALFDPAAEVIADFKEDRTLPRRISSEAIMEMLQRRPCTSLEIAQVLGVHQNEVLKYLGSLTRTSSVDIEERDGRTYYRAVRSDANRQET